MTEVEEACYHLLNVWWQYGKGPATPRHEGRIFLSHGHMRAGEEAGEFLVARGYAKDYGDGILLTKEAEAFMEQDI